MKSIDVQRVATVGLDLGKRWFHVYGVDVQGEQVVNRRLPRSRVASLFEDLPRCRVAMETCGGAQNWGRLLAAMGHDVKLIPAQFVRPYVKGCSYQGTSLRYSNSRGCCPEPSADGHVPCSRLRLTAADSSAAAGITHGAPLHA